MASTAWGTYELTMKASLKANEQTINLLIPALEEAIKNAISNNFDRKQISNNASKRFSEKVIGDKYFEELKKILDDA